MMTPRERLLSAFLGRPVDRVPLGVSFGWHPWGETLERWKRETGRADLDPGCCVAGPTCTDDTGLYPAVMGALAAWRLTSGLVH